jgi:CBS-domain-containing membrane protein
MATTRAGTAATLVLDAEQAADLMNPRPVSVAATATAPEIIEVLTQRGFGAAPVIDERGRAAGVVSRADLLIHERERLRASGPPHAADRTTAVDLMTPAVFSVTPQTPAAKVIEQMLGFNVHQLYVVDDHGVLVGVIAAHDVLRRLTPAP